MEPLFLMNIQRIKGLVWVGTLAVGATLAWSVYGFLQNKQELAAGVDKDERYGVLNDVQEPPAPKEDLVDYRFVTQSFHEMNWTGKEPPPPPVDPTEVDPSEVRATPIASLLNILVVQMDTNDDEGSLAFVSYGDPELAAMALEDSDLYILRIGTALPGKHSYAKVSAIAAEGVEFSFADETREKEIVPPVPFPSSGPGIVRVGAGGVILPQAPTGIAASPEGNRYRPKVTVEIGKNEYQLGTETVETMAVDYTKILSQDIRTRVHKDPRTGKVDGLEITSVRSGSLPAGHGISDGEVLKSINGHPVTSKADAINFVKKESDHTDTWVAVFDKRGRLIERVYHSPEN